jgi:pantoate--beta-alanine ligase
MSPTTADVAHPAILTRVAEARHAAAAARRAGRTVALVPTMGFLHEGHLSLIDAAHSAADDVWLSVFVNPTQFGEGEDLDRYPQDLDRDVRLAADRGIEVVFAPSPDEMYPFEPGMWVVPGDLGAGLCGASRPTHFRGVLTVVLKLLEIVHPDVAVFGRKDLQQAMLIRRMVDEFHVPVEVLVAPIVREPDGLAMSSRNVYLSGDERHRASALSRSLRAARQLYAAGQRDPEALREIMIGTLEDSAVRVDYAEIVSPDTLRTPVEASDDTMCAVAGFLGSTRLIDNAPLGEPCEL